MTEMQTMVQRELSVNGSSYLLAQNQDVEELKQRIEAAVATTGRFVEFVVVGNRALSVLVTPTTQITLAGETVQFDPRDTGDEGDPYGGIFDL